MKKEKYKLEYSLSTVSPSVLWMYVATESGLTEWFADEVTMHDKKVTFCWDKFPQTAHITTLRRDHFIRYRWEDEEEDEKCYFEFRFHSNELTSEMVLEVIDFSSSSELADNVELWNKQIRSLKRTLGV